MGTYGSSSAVAAEASMASEGLDGSRQFVVKIQYESLMWGPFVSQTYRGLQDAWTAGFLHFDGRDL